MFSISAINDTDSRGQWEPLAPTKEAQEFHLTQTYHDGLLRLQDKDYPKARELFEIVLKDPLISTSHVNGAASDGHLLQLRFLALKNLATVFLQQGSEHYENALHCYLQAVAIDTNDSVVWNQLGTLSCKMDLLSTSRWAFEQGLVCSPNNWNCMEKLLEVLIAVGDEVSCLAVAELILRHWPSHCRAFHVKKTIEEAEPTPFAPRGIDKLEPKHARLEFTNKREATDSEMDGSTRSKRCKNSIDVKLHEATWAALADAILHVILHTTNPHEMHLLDGEVENEDYVRQKAACKSTDTIQKYEKEEMFNNLKVDIHLCSSPGASMHTFEGKGQNTNSVSTNSTASSDTENFRTVKDKEVLSDKEHPQERRSSRLERLRSRKSGKEDAENADGKDIAKTVFRFLEPFILGRSEDNRKESFGSCYGPSPDIPVYYSSMECSDVTCFIKDTSMNYGAFHIANLILEEVARLGIAFQDSFVKFIELEKLTRNMGLDRSPLCSLFLAELYFDLGFSSTSESTQSELFTQSSYHLCKVIESVVLDSSDDLDWIHVGNPLTGDCMTDNDSAMMIVECAAPKETLHAATDSQDLNVAVVEDSLSQESTKQNALNEVSYRSYSFWIRFYWLSARLSLSSNCKEKAYREFCICLSILSGSSKSGKSFDHVLLPHCKNHRRLSADMVLHEINLLKLDSLLSETFTEMIQKEMEKDCVNLLAPLLLATKDVYIGAISGSYKESERLVSVELSALDLLMSECGKEDTMNIEVLMKCHRRKLQILTVAAGMMCFPIQQNQSVSEPKSYPACDSDRAEGIGKHFVDMVASEVKMIAHTASRVKHFVDQNSEDDDSSSLVSIIGDIQFLLLSVMNNAVKAYLGNKHSVPGTPTQDQLESWCLIDAAIAFCKLQYLDPSVTIKAQVDLIVAVHDLLAEYGLCCAGKNTEGDKGLFLKHAIKHLLALDMKLKSVSGRLDVDKKHQDDSVVLQVTEKAFSDSSRLTSLMNLDSHSNKEPATSQRDESEDQITGHISSKVELDKGDKFVSGNDIKEVQFDALREPIVRDNCTDNDDELVIEDTQKLELRIENALDQSFFCLYGLDINPDPSSDDELAIHKNTNRGDYQTKEQCADVFQYILPYANALSRSGMVKLRRVLRAIRKHFPQPPDEILAGNAIDGFLDGSDALEDKLSELPCLEGRQELIMNILSATGRIFEASKILSTISSDPYVEVYSNLYYLIAQAEEISALDKYAGFVLQKEGEEFVQHNANLFKYDLIYNPLRFESWQKLANIYDEEVDLLLNDGSKRLSIAEMRKNTLLHHRVEIGRRRSRRCLLMSLALAKTPAQESQMHELLALVYYDNLQNVVPLYDQRSVQPMRDASWMEFCQNSMKHFEKAFALKPEWLHAFYLGKLSEKMGFPPEKALAYYEKAAALSPSAVDPVYRLHASRMKLLFTRGRADLDVLKTATAYAFNQSTKEVVMEKFNQNQGLQELIVDTEDGNVHDNIDKQNDNIQIADEAWHVLYKDCLSALQVCVEGDLKHFHKARYMLARGFYERGVHGDLERAKDELSFCFKSSRSPFTINMWEIDGVTRKGRRKCQGISGSRRILEVGLSESSRKFITCIRKYILFYLHLLEKTGDLLTLERAYAYLRTDKRFSLCLGDIVPIAIGKYVEVLTRSLQNTESHGATEKSTSAEQLLEKIFNIFMDHASLWSEISCLPEVKNPDLSESNLCSYVHQYIHVLESDLRLEFLEGVNEKIRKRFKNPKLSTTNFARLCKHASLAWCRSLLIKLARITPLPDSGVLPDQVSASENNVLLFIDLEPDELLTSATEDNPHSKGIDMNWYEALSRIKNICVRQAAEDNIEAAISLMRCAYSFYKESSCGIHPSGISIYTVPSSKVASTGLELNKEVFDVLDLSIPRKLLLWSYTLVHGRYMNISSVVKYCEEHVKSRMRRALAVSPSPHLQSSNPTSASHPGVGEIEENTPVTATSTSIPPPDSATSTNVPNSVNEPQKVGPTLQLQRCKSTNRDQKQEEPKPHE